MKHLERFFTPKFQDNSEKGDLIVSQTFDFNFLPFQGHKNHFSYLHLTLKIDLKVKIDGTVKCLPRSWQPLFKPFFRRQSILEDIWDYRLKWVTVYISFSLIVSYSCVVLLLSLCILKMQLPLLKISHF